MEEHQTQKPLHYDKSNVDWFKNFNKMMGIRGVDITEPCYCWRHYANIMDDYFIKNPNDEEKVFRWTNTNNDIYGMFVFLSYEKPERIKIYFDKIKNDPDNWQLAFDLSPHLVWNDSSMKDVVDGVRGIMENHGDWRYIFALAFSWRPNREWAKEMAVKHSWVQLAKELVICKRADLDWYKKYFLVDEYLLTNMENTNDK